MRKCRLLTPCCGKEYMCRICHDEVEDHNLDRRSVAKIICIQCNKKQAICRNCEECGILFGRYTCLICRLFDDNEKKQFHCVGCGICRVGGRENFFHCPKCNICISKSILETHKCVENMSRGKCPVCLDDLHSSRKKVDIPDCSHMIHSECLVEMFKHGRTSCPTCNTSLVDMKSVWQNFDEVVASTPMPEIYRNYHVSILCRDCHEVSKVPFHVIGLKCASCGGYNTTRIGGDDPLPEDASEHLENLSVTPDIAVNSDDSHDSWETIYTEEDETNTLNASDSDAIVVLLPSNVEDIPENSTELTNFNSSITDGILDSNDTVSDSQPDRTVERDASHSASSSSNLEN